VGVVVFLDAVIAGLIIIIIIHTAPTYSTSTRLHSIIKQSGFGTQNPKQKVIQFFTINIIMVEYTLWDSCVNLDIPKDVFPTDEEIQEMDGNFDSHCEHGYFSPPRHNQKLHYRKWTPPAGTVIKGVLVWQHGIMGECGMACRVDDQVYKAAVIVKMAIKAGYIMYSLDMLGHGFSEGVRFLIPDSDWTINRDDLASFAMFVSKQEVEKSSKNLPLFLGGESYGSCLSIHVARKWMDGSKEEKPLNFKGICILAPGTYVICLLFYDIFILLLSLGSIIYHHYPGLII
jgi:hypothetical protein